MQMAAIADSLDNNNTDAAERERIMSQYEAGVQASQARMTEQRDGQRDALIARIAARKRMKEEQDREQAVSDELNRITLIKVIKVTSELEQFTCV